VGLHQIRSRTSTNPKTHHHVSVFFTTQHRGILLLKFGADALFSLVGPLVQGGTAQPTQLSDHQVLHLVGALQRALRIADDLQNAVDPFLDLGMIAQLLDQTDLLRGDGLGDCFLPFHPDCN
jgi:hypothetical protein